MLDWPLLSGHLLVAMRVGGSAAALWLLTGTLRVARSPRARAVSCTMCLLTAVVVPLVGVHIARDVWLIFPDRLPVTVYLWVGAGVLAVAMSVALVTLRCGARRAVLAVAASITVIATCLNEVNVMFAAYPTPRDVFGIAHPTVIALPNRHQKPLPPSDFGPLEQTWVAPAGLALQGKIASELIPSTVSGFAARPAKIYLPPAYFADPPPRLPVLVLLSGQPGSPQDWISAGKLVRIMDAFASAHRGLAPVVVVPDATGSPLGDPLCLDSRRGRSDTYLAIDVPAWIKGRLTVDVRPNAWAVAGASYGGTCALQLATNHPSVYPNFVDIAGSAEPTLGDRSRTVIEAFGGDEQAFTRVNPLDLLRSHRYPNSAAAIVIGKSDHDNKPDAKQVLEATKAAGMDSHYTEVTGSHDWRAFSAALSAELPWLARRAGLIS
jgi:S-formylglutathione hydrolase FrmB